MGKEGEEQDWTEGEADVWRGLTESSGAGKALHEAGVGHGGSGGSMLSSPQL